MDISNSDSPAKRHYSAWLTNTLPKLIDRSNLSFWNSYSSSAWGNAIPVDWATRRVTEAPSPILLEPFRSFKAQMMFLSSITCLMGSFFIGPYSLASFTCTHRLCPVSWRPFVVSPPFPQATLLNSNKSSRGCQPGLRWGWMFASCCLIVGGNSDSWGLFPWFPHFWLHLPDHTQGWSVWDHLALLEQVEVGGSGRTLCHGPMIHPGSCCPLSLHLPMVKGRRHWSSCPTMGLLLPPSHQ